MEILVSHWQESDEFGDTTAGSLAELPHLRLHQRVAERCPSPLGRITGSQFGLGNYHILSHFVHLLVVVGGISDLEIFCLGKGGSS